MGIDESTIKPNLVEAVYDGEAANAFRTDLKMKGTASDFIQKGGPENFKEKLSGSLKIQPTQIQLVSIKEGSVILSYDVIVD
jgi:hypothetical protein